MVPAVALADDEHNVRRAKRTTIHLDLLARFYQSHDLLGSQGVGIKTERETRKGRIEHRMVGLREHMFHITDCATGVNLHHGLLIGKARGNAPREESDDERPQPGRHPVEERFYLRPKPGLLPCRHAMQGG